MGMASMEAAQAEAFYGRPERATAAEEDSFVYFGSATWEDYERLLAMRGECAVPRITFLEGVIELVSPSRSHENLKSVIGRLVEVWCLEKDIRFTTLGSWTLTSKKHDRGAEPDECYIFGDPNVDKPHLAIEVVWSGGGIDKLNVYRKLGVAEVWYWRNSTIEVHVLVGDQYERSATSRALPGIDLEFLASFLDRPSTYDAIRDYRSGLQRRTTK